MRVVVQLRALLAAQDAYANAPLPLTVAAALDVVAAGSADASGGGGSSLLALSTLVAAAVGAAFVTLVVLVALVARRRRTKRLEREQQFTTRISGQQSAAAHGSPARQDGQAGGGQDAGDGAPAPARASSATSLAGRADPEQAEESKAAAAPARSGLRNIAATYGGLARHGSTDTRPEEPDAMRDGLELSMLETATLRVEDAQHRPVHVDSEDTLNSADFDLDEPPPAPLQLAWLS